MKKYKTFMRLYSIDMTLILEMLPFKTPLFDYSDVALTSAISREAKPNRLYCFVM